MNATTETLANQTLARPNFDVDKIRADFPILSREVYGKPLVFLDSAASAMKPAAGGRHHP